MKNARFWVERLGLEPHPEGGFYKATYASGRPVESPHGPRPASTAIYFLLERHNFSAFHRLRSDEVWHFYAGSPITVWMILPSGEISVLRLGPDAGFQGVVAAGCWFAAGVDGPGEYALVGCTVAPGFDFADLELAEREALTSEYPQHAELIRRFTRQ